ncbi:MAG TPA: enoyl-CoA hydratase-related protein [Nevskiaceae bacterium]|nr:enoyl-CoA hydratase-related protein [Nevskiaceae bacterium]
MDYQTLLVNAADGVTRITLNRPDKLNALSLRLLAELGQALEAAASDAACRCVLLTGAGRGFSAGADLTDTGGTPPTKPGVLFDFEAALENGYHPVFRLLRGMEKPVVAAVNGTAAGAGCNLALAADFTVATRSARFIQSFIKIGLVPDAGGTWTIPRLIGRARALRWMMSGESIDAETAERWGLLAAVYDDADFAREAEALALRLAKQPTRALAGIKQLVDASLAGEFDAQLRREAQMQGKVGVSKDTMEGIMAFIQKREARFTGK